MGYCGINCKTCDCYIAANKNDDSLREKVAREWTEKFHFDFTKEMINCTGCDSDGVKVGYCNMCEIRSCAIDRKIDECKKCPEFPCDKINSFFNK